MSVDKIPNNMRGDSENEAKKAVKFLTKNIHLLQCNHGSETNQ